MTLQDIQTFLGMLSSIILILGIPFAVYNFYLKDRRRDGNKINDTEKSDIILAKDIQLLRTELTSEVKSLANVLGIEMRNITDALHLIKQNDLHSIYEKQRDQDAQLNKHTVTIEKLATIIEERVPRKTVDEVV